MSNSQYGWCFVLNKSQLIGHSMPGNQPYWRKHANDTYDIKNIKIQAGTRHSTSGFSFFFCLWKQKDLPSHLKLPWPSTCCVVQECYVCAQFACLYSIDKGHWTKNTVYSTLCAQFACLYSTDNGHWTKNTVYLTLCAQFACLYSTDNGHWTKNTVYLTLCTQLCLAL